MEGIKQNWKKLTPRYFLLHTISHLLIRSISNFCGYSLSSIRKIYSNNSLDNNGINQSEFFYILFLRWWNCGLAGMAEIEKITDLIKTALHDGEWCSGDPLC